MAKDQHMPNDLLHAYVDNQLSLPQREQVEAYLQDHPELGRESRDHQRLNQTLHALFDPALDRKAPESVLALLTTNDHSAPTNLANATSQSAYRIKPAIARRMFQGIAAGVLLILGSMLGWIMRGELTPGSATATAALESLAVDAHRIYANEIRHAVEVPAGEQNHLMKWLSARLGESVGPAKLTADGYELLGGRLLPAEGKPAGMYLYRGPHEVKLTYYITKQPAVLEKSKTVSLLDCHVHKNSAATVCSWTHATLLYFVIADEPVARLRAVSQKIREQTSQP